MTKYLLVIGDGMADDPVPELGGRTPLQAAQIPTIDALCAKGILGTVRNCPPGLPAGSDTAITAILGCDPRRYYTGRAPLEAAAAGLKLNPGDVAYRCNLVTVEDGALPFGDRRLLSHSGGSVDGDTSDALLAALLADAEFAAAAHRARLTLLPGHSFRHLAVQQGASVQGLDLTPPHDHLGQPLGPLLPQGSETASALRCLMELAHSILDHHPLNEARRAAGALPANGIWFWAEGTAAELPDFAGRFGHTGGVVSAVPLCLGIAALLGLEPVQPEGATGELDTDLESKVAATLALLERHDFAVLHVEAPDECTHNGDLAGKLQAIEWLDSRCLTPLLEAFAEKQWDYRILLLSDHKTLTATRGHDGAPVPFLLYDSRENTGGGQAFCEESARLGPAYPDGAAACMRLLFEL